VNRSPLVTIITPAYNRATLIAETIESVLGQDYPHLEYIVLDDGSTDATLEVIKGYEGRLRWESHANVGEAHTVNAGFSMAQGEILGVVNSDDPLLPGAVGRMVAALQANPDALVAYPDWRLIDARGNALQEIRCRDYVSFAEMLSGHHCLPGPGAFFRRQALEKASGRDPAYRYVGDLDFWLRIGWHGRFVRVPEVLATFRVHDSSASVCCQSELMAEEQVAVIVNLFAREKADVSLHSLRKVSMLNAFHAAACHLGRGRVSSLLSYILKSITCCPGVFFTKYFYRIPIYMLMLLGFNYSAIKYNITGLKYRLRLK